MKNIFSLLLVLFSMLNTYSQSSLQNPFNLTTYNYLQYSPPPGIQAQAGPDYGCLTGRYNGPVWFTYNVCGADSGPDTLWANLMGTSFTTFGVILWGPFDDTINIANKLTAANIDTCFLTTATGLNNIAFTNVKYPSIYYGMISVDSGNALSQFRIFPMTYWIDDRCGISNSRVANYKQDICMVTIDSSTQKNMLVWENKFNFQTASFNIYREGVVANQYDSIGNVPVTGTSTYIDNAVNPNQRSYKYKLAAIDSSGQTALFYNTNTHDSAITHATIHVQASAGLNNEVNLAWNAYVGFPYNTFYIYRGATTSSFTILDSVSSGTFAYTDFNAPSGLNYYKVTVRKNGGCSPDGGTTVYLQAFSNNPYALSVGIDDFSQDSPYLLGPNPTNSDITITFRKPVDCIITIYNSIGENVYSDTFKGTEKILNCNLTKGVYLLRVNGKELNSTRKIVIQ